MGGEQQPLAPGAVIDGFTLEERLHTGGMATIWRVSRPGTPCPCVMKIPRTRYGDDPAAIVSFEVEAMVLPRLTGPHVPRFVAAGDFTEHPYLVLEHIPGPSLHDEIATVMFSAERVARIGALVAAALHDIHRQDVIHLDLKPSNILFRPGGEAVLIDFGLANHARLPDLHAEEQRLPVGTGAYLAPEQVLQVRNDPRSDIFALGAILYYLITGERPFGDPSSVEGLKRRLYRDPAPPRTVNSACPAWLQEVILRCMEVDPAKRFSSAAEVALLLNDPGQVELTERAERGRRTGWFASMLRRFALLEGPAEVAPPSVSQRLDAVPIVMAAVDTSPGQEALAETLQRAVRRIISVSEGARLTVVTVRKVPRVGIDLGVDTAGRNLTVQRLVELKHWARPLELPAERVTFHVLEGTDPAVTLVDYARQNHVDHLVIGARGASALRRFLGSVSARVVAEAPCTVTVVRMHHSAAAAAAAPVPAPGTPEPQPGAPESRSAAEPPSGES